MRRRRFKPFTHRINSPRVEPTRRVAARLRAMLVLLCLAVPAASCYNGPPPVNQYFTQLQIFVDEDDTRTKLLAEIESAERRVEAAFTRLTDNEIAQAIVNAQERGAAVRVVGDEDFREDSGFQILLDNDVDVVFGDGVVRYLPDPNLAPLVDNCGIKDDLVQCPPPEDADDSVPSGAVHRPGSFNLMSHNFVILEKTTIWNLTAPLDGQNTFPIAYRANSERMREVFMREFNQLHGGVFATTLDVYNGPVKSQVQNNPDFQAESYLTANGELQLRFNPQERLTKSVIDEVYRARASVYLMTDNLAEDFLLDALEYKARHFDVRVIVNADAQSPQTAQRLEAFDFVRYAPEGIEYLPTVVLYDVAPDRDDEQRPRRAQVISHPLWRTGPFRVRSDQPLDVIEVHPSDYFVDGNMWSFVEYRGRMHEVPEIDQLEALFERVWNDSEAP